MKSHGNNRSIFHNFIIFANKFLFQSSMSSYKEQKCLSKFYSYQLRYLLKFIFELYAIYSVKVLRLHFGNYDYYYEAHWKVHITNYSNVTWFVVRQIVLKERWQRNFPIIFYYNNDKYEVFQTSIHTFHLISVSWISNNKNYKRSPKFKPNDIFNFKNCTYIIHIKFSHLFLKFLALLHPPKKKKLLKKDRSLSPTGYISNFTKFL